MDAWTDPRVSLIVLRKCTQIGFTEILLNILGFIMDQDAGPTLCVTSDIMSAKTWSQDRLTPMLRDTPCLRGKIIESERREAKNTLQHKVFPGGHVTLVGSNSASGLSGRPVRYLLYDEIDRYKPSAGKQGDPITLGRRRAQTFWNRKEIHGSSPVDKLTSRIDAEFEASDKRFCWVGCPHCGVKQRLVWAQVEWSPPFGDGTPGSTVYVCEHCGASWSDGERWRAVRETCEWRAEAPFNGVAGFALNELYSSFVELADPVRAFLEAQGDPELMRVWVNTVLGEAWEDKGEEMAAQPLFERREAWSAPPATVLLVTVGVDVQGDRLEAVRLGWAMQEECFVLEHRVFHGDPSGPRLWEQLDDYLLTPTVLASGRELQVAAACIDSGGHYSDSVHTFCRTRMRRRVWSIKGAAGTRSIWPKKASRTLKGRDLVYVIGVDAAKDMIYARLKLKTPGPGYFHFPTSLGDLEFFVQLTSEAVYTRRSKGRLTRAWEPKPNTRTEALDCTVYAMAALRSMPLSWERVRQRLGAAAAARINATEAVSGGIPVEPGPQPAQSVGEQPPGKLAQRPRTRVLYSTYLRR
jgi:phage terminase large subunit GpA-like protein